MDDIDRQPRQGPKIAAFDAATPSRAAPLVRVSFYEEQRRRRRGSWRRALACLGVAAAMGIIVSAFVTPLVLGVVGAFLRVLAWAGVYPRSSATLAREVGKWAAQQLDHIGKIVDGLDRVHGLADFPTLFSSIATLWPVFLPGIAASTLVWLLLRRLSIATGMAEFPAAIGARAPRVLDREEQQIANILAEMTIAAGLEPLRLLIVDSPAANAGAMGGSHRDATVLVTRGLLDDLDRDETSAVIGHVVASIGNGDLRLAHSLLALFQTLGFFLTILDLPFRRAAWGALGGIARAALPWRRSPQSTASAAQGLEDSLSAESMEALNAALAGGRYPRLRLALMAPLLPLIMVSLFLKMTLQLWTMLVLGWPLALLWRTRRYLADSAAVQLTRNPEALAAALRRLSSCGAVPQGGASREYLFMYGSQLRAKEGFRERRNIAASLEPSVENRLARVAAMGAQVTSRTTRWHPFAIAGVALLVVVLAPLFAALAILVLFLTLFTIEITLMLGLVLVAAIFG